MARRFVGAESEKKEGNHLGSCPKSHKGTEAPDSGGDMQPALLWPPGWSSPPSASPIARLGRLAPLTTLLAWLANAAVAGQSWCARIWALWPLTRRGSNLHGGIHRRSPLAAYKQQGTLWAAD